jgi:hypothetical protein
MSDEPTYPKEAAVGAEAASGGDEATAAGAQGNPESEGKRRKYVKAGVAVGIGSAAIVAALLYANRGKRSGDRHD